jgi:hypothetical protein
MEVHSMGVLFLIILAAAILIILLFSAALKIRVILDTDNSDLNMTLLWLQPFFKAVITLEESKPVLVIYLFNRKLYKKVLKLQKKRPSNMNLVRITNPKDIHVKTQYGFTDPSMTGITCGAVNLASQLINIDEITHIPDFTAYNDYIYFDATAEVNIGSTLINLMKSKNSKLRNLF